MIAVCVVDVDIIALRVRLTASDAYLKNIALGDATWVIAAADLSSTVVPEWSFINKNEPEDIMSTLGCDYCEGGFDEVSYVQTAQEPQQTHIEQSR